MAQNPKIQNNLLIEITKSPKIWTKAKFNSRSKNTKSNLPQNETDNLSTHFGGYFDIKSGPSG